jgi:hypothetical protein
MPLDPSIILGARPAQFDMAQFSPMNAMASVMKFKQLDQENKINALKMQEYERARTEEQGLRQYLSGGPEVEAPDLASPETRRNLLRYGKAGAAQAKALSEQDTAALTQRKVEFEIQKSRKDFIAQAQRDTSQNPSDANITAYKEDLMANPLFTNAEKAQMAKGADRILAMPVDQRQQFMASQGASASELKPSTQTVNRSGQTDVLQMPAFGGKPTTVGSYADVPLPANVQAQKIQIARESRPPRAEAQPVAPTITQIVDPTNSNQMIAVDARRYQGGGPGSPGVIGIGGKEPGAALRINKVEEGKSQLANDLDNLRSSFAELDRLRAIPSTERNVVSNLMSATAASGVGQAMGRAGGSPEQVERDVINSARQRLVSSIKNATGMSSKSLDSNVELQTMLRSISDPGQSVEAAMRIIDDIEAAYVKGSGTLPKRSQPGAGAQGASGFKYLGKESNK